MIGYFWARCPGMFGGISAVSGRRMGCNDQPRRICSGHKYDSGANVLQQPFLYAQDRVSQREGAERKPQDDMLGLHDGRGNHSTREAMSGTRVETSRRKGIGKSGKEGEIVTSSPPRECRGPKGVEERARGNLNGLDADLDVDGVYALCLLGGVGGKGESQRRAAFWGSTLTGWEQMVQGFPF